MNKLLLAIILSAVMGCSNSKDAADSAPAYVSEAEARFGTAYECEPNSSGEYVLCSHQPDGTATQPLPDVAFFVYSANSGEVSIEEPYFTGDVKWIDEFELELELVPGIVSTERVGRPKFRLDVRTGTREGVGSDDIPK